MLSLTQLLIFELGSGCNLGAQHTHCPNRSAERYAGLNTGRTLDSEIIIESAAKAYLDYGFQGVVGWHYYNEPLLEAERMFDLINSIRNRAPQSRFILWTNGTMFPADKSKFSAFDCIIVTRYRGQNYGELNFHPNLHVREEMFDRRMDELLPLEFEPCCRPLVECIFDFHGNHHPCCNDWRGNSSLGNLFTDGFDSIIARWREFQEATFIGKLSPGCQKCGVRYRDIQPIDRRSVETIAQWIEQKTLRKEPIHG